MTSREALAEALRYAVSEGRPYALVNVSDLERLLADTKPYPTPLNGDDVIGLLMKSLEQTEARHDEDRRIIEALTKICKEKRTNER